MTKTDLRKLFLARRVLIGPDEAAQKSRAIARAVLSSPQYLRAGKMMAYSALPGEADSSEIIAAALGSGKTVCLPKVHRPPKYPSKGLWACRINGYPDGLAPGAFGVLEVPDGKEQRISADELDLVIIPGLAFDAAGFRLGYGAGYYDRFLSDPGFRAVTIGVCFAVQVTEALPKAPHDQRVEFVATEEGLRACRL